MYVISKREFFNLFKGIKSIIIIAILLVTSYYSAKFSNVLMSDIELTAREAENIHYSWSSDPYLPIWNAFCNRSFAR